MIIAIILIVIVVIIIGWLISVSNNIEKAKIKIDEASSGIDVALTKRYDVLTKMIDVVKAYTKHEQETMFKTIELRKDMTISEKNEANKQMDSQFSKINALAESYPELKANENFKELSKDLSKIEEDIANSRKYYNGTVRTYNDKIEMVPSNIVAGIFGFKTRTMFEVDAAERENVKVKF